MLLFRATSTFIVLYGTHKKEYGRTGPVTAGE